MTFYTLIKTQFSVKIKALRLDNAKEFKSTKWSLFCSNKGIICEYTSPYSAPQNGIAERLNRYLVERLIAICKEKNIPLFLWPTLIQAIAHIKNRTYNPIINKTPYEALIGHKPNIAYIKTLGSLAYTLIPKEKRKGKLDERANKGILVGFESSNNFLVYIPNLHEVINTKDVLIKEDLYYNKEYTTRDNYNELLDISTIENDYEDDYLKASIIEDNSELEGDSSSIDEFHDTSLDELNSEYYNNNNTSNTLIEGNNLERPTTISNTSTEGDNSERPTTILEENNSIDELSLDYYNSSNITRCSPRLRGDTPSSQGLSIYKLASYAYYTTLNEDNKDTNSDKIILPKDLNIKEPKDYREANSSTYKEYWLKAEEKELDSLRSNNTWELVPKPKDAKVLNTRWVYKLKPNKDDTVEFKARFVAKGFEQIYGLDYIDTFAAIVKQLAWRLLFALAVLNKWIIYKIDMISAFTQGNIDTNIYIKQPLGHIDPNNPNHVLRLNKAPIHNRRFSPSTYGQSLRSSNHHITS
jgi:hypothetical protein